MPSVADPSTALRAPFSLAFDAPPGFAVPLSAQGWIPFLEDAARRSHFGAAIPVGNSGGFQLLSSGRWLLGCASIPLEEGLQSASHRVYGELLVAARGWNLCRIWNYVPAINNRGPGGLENYRAFSAGRSLAFESVFGPGYKSHLPAASAVGHQGDRLAVVFAACADEPVHCENPSQTPAYDYPTEYGPRPPSFARATFVPDRDGLRDVFVSGTSAIRGHATMAEGDTISQVACTLTNLREISRVCGAGDDLAAGRAASRHIVVYLRHRDDLREVSGLLDRELIRAGDHTTFLLADICRAELNVEIECCLFGVAG
jgi:hypothetical protein